jgi:PAC2 family
MLFVQDHWESYEAPSLSIVRLVDSAGAPYLLMHGSEPDVMWDRFSEAVVQVVDRLGVRLTVGTNAIPMGVPHTRPVGVTAHASRPEMVSDYQPWVGTVQVPGSAAHLIEHRLAVTGHDSMGFAVHVPHYLAQAGFPPAAEALLAALSRATGLSLPIGSLPDASREAHETIAGLVAQSDELTELVRTLETQYDAVVAARGDALADGLTGTDLPTADELGAELERFLADQTKRPDDPLT